MSEIIAGSPRENKGDTHVVRDNASLEISGDQIDDLICHCFKYTRADIKQDLIRNGQSIIMEKITAEKKAGRCDCANKNPKSR